jgi:hypothetical protein
MSAQLDGSLNAVVKEIAKLHGEILLAARTSLTKAIRIGGLLGRVRVSRKGKWLSWLKDNAPFSQKTAWNYMACYQRRAELELVNVTNLSDAYALLLPAKTTGNTPRVSPSNDGQKNRAPNDALISSDGETAPVPVEQTRPQRRRKSRDGIMDAISSENLERELKQSQIGIDKLFTDTLAQISRQSHAAWSEFPDRLLERGNALIAQGQRLRTVKGSKTSGASLARNAPL